MKADSPNVLSFPVPVWLCALVAIVAWLGGTISEYNSAAKQQPDAQTQRLHPEAQKQSSTLLSQSGSREPVTGGTGGAASGFSPVSPEGSSGITFAAALPPGLDRLKAFYEAVKSINASNWHEIAQAANQAWKGKHISEAEETWIYQRIGEIAGPEAMKFFAPTEELTAQHFKRGALSTLHGWAAKDPGAAWAYLEQLPDSQFRDVQVSGFIRAALQKDPSQAQQALQTMTPQGQGQFLLESLNGGTPASYAQLAESWLSASTANDSGNFTGTQGAVFGNIVRLKMGKGLEYAGSPEMAGWLTTYADKNFTVGEPLRRVIQAQSINDPSRALSLVELMLPKEQPLRPQQSWNIISESVAMLLASNPDAGLRWITERQNSPLYGPAVYALLAEQGAGMTEATIQSWLDSVPDSDIRKRIIDIREKQKSAPPGTDHSLSARVKKAMGG